MNTLDYQNTGYVSDVVGTIITGGSLDALIGHLAIIQGICRWRIYPSEWVDENDQSTGSRLGLLARRNCVTRIYSQIN